MFEDHKATHWLSFLAGMILVAFLWSLSSRFEVENQSVPVPDISEVHLEEPDIRFEDL